MRYLPGSSDLNKDEADRSGHLRDRAQVFQLTVNGHLKSLNDVVCFVANLQTGAVDSTALLACNAPVEGLIS